MRRHHYFKSTVARHASRVGQQCVKKRRRRGRGKKKRSGRRRAAATQRAIAREERDYTAIHKRFFKNFAQAIAYITIDPDFELPPPDHESCTRIDIVRAWSEFYEEERLQKGYDLSRKERCYFAYMRNEMRINDRRERENWHKSRGTWDYDDVCDDDNSDPWEAIDEYGGENLVVF